MADQVSVFSRFGRGMHSFEARFVAGRIAAPTEEAEFEALRKPAVDAADDVARALADLDVEVGQKFGELDAIKEATEAERIATAEVRDQAAVQAGRAEEVVDSVPEILETRDVVLPAAAAAVEARDKVLGEPTAVRLRRDQRGDETFGEPETIAVGDKLFRQVTEDGRHFIPGGLKISPRAAPSPQEWSDFQFAFTLLRGLDEVSALGFDWEGRVDIVPTPETSARVRDWISAAGTFASQLGLTAAQADYNAKVAAVTASLIGSINATARARREQANDETFGEPETLALGGKLFRQVREDGVHYLPGGVEIDAATLSQDWRDFLFAFSLKRGSDRVTPLAIDWDGLIELFPNDATYRRIQAWLANNGGGSNGYLPANTLRADYSAYPGLRIWPIGTKAGQVVAQVQDRGGQTYRAFERTAGSTALAVVEGPPKMACAMYLGQSTAGKAGDNLAPDQKAHFAATRISFATVNQIHGTDGTNVPAWSAQAELGPLRNVNGDGQLPMVTIELALAQFRCDHGLAEQGVLSFTSWKGSTSLHNLDKTGTTNAYANSIAQLTNANALIANHERTGVAVTRYWLSQGENSASANGWAADFAAFKANYNADVPAVTGQAAPGQWFITQTNTTGGYNANCLAQNAVHDSGAAIMASSCINLPLSADDGIHPTGLGTMIRGDQDAHAILSWERDGYWSPPREKSCTISGVTVTLRVELPRDTTAFGKVLDRHAPPQVTQDGFALVYDGGNSVAITSVAYAIDPATGDGVVTLQLAGAPGANPRLKYGTHFETAFVAGATTDPPVFASRTGNVLATQAQRSFWQRAGYDVPRFVRQPLRRFEIAIS